MTSLLQQNDSTRLSGAPYPAPLGAVSELAFKLLSEHTTRARKRPVKVLLYPLVWLRSYKILRLEKRIAHLLSAGGDRAADARSVAEAIAVARLPMKVESRVVAMIAKQAAKAGETAFVKELLGNFFPRGSPDNQPASFFFILQEAGRYREAARLSARLLQLPTLRPSLRKQIESQPSVLINALSLIEGTRPPQIERQSRHIAYIAASSLPYSTTGYTTRTHGVAHGYRDSGFKIDVITQPYFPLNMRKDLDPRSIAALDVIDGIPYHRLLSPQRGRGQELTFLREGADALEVKIRELKPSHVIAASDYMNSLPALIAARRLGLPFVYEVRGMWELTRLSREPGFEQTPQFAVTGILEREVALRADYVLTLTEPMRQNLISRGVDPAKIALMPNGINASAVRAVPRDDRLAQKLGIERATPVIGYIGSILPYEGLPDLAVACAGLATRGLDFRLLIVGREAKTAGAPTPITDEMRQVFASAGIAERLIMPGHVPHSEVASYYSLIDIAPIPRRSFAVTELVSPIKPMEALATGKVLIVSDVEALKDFAQGGQTGILFEKDNVRDLEEKLLMALSNASLRASLAVNGPQFVRSERTWQAICQKAAKFVGLTEESSEQIS